MLAEQLHVHTENILGEFIFQRESRTSRDVVKSTLGPLVSQKQ